MDTQHIQFVTNVDELVDAYERYWRRAPVGRTQRRRGTLGVAASLAVSLFVTAWVLGAVSRSLVLPLAGIALVLGAASSPLSRFLYDRSFRRRLRRVLTQEAGERTSWLCEVELRDEGVWARGRGIESLYDWRELTWLQDDGDTIEFHFRGSFVMVRARAFSGPAERERFLDAARIQAGVDITRTEHQGRRPPRARRGILIAAGLALIGVAAFVAITRRVPTALPTGSYRATFDSAAWRDIASADFVNGDITVRQKMLGDVVKNVLPGRTRAELESILGPSMDTAYFKSSGRDLIYVLGPERDSYFTIDFEWLLIWLDSTGRFERYAIYRD